MLVTVPRSWCPDKGRYYVDWLMQTYSHHLLLCLLNHRDWKAKSVTSHTSDLSHSSQLVMATWLSSRQWNISRSPWRERGCLMSWRKKKASPGEGFCCYPWPSPTSLCWNKEVLPRQEEAILWEWEEHDEGLCAQDGEAKRCRDPEPWLHCGTMSGWLYQPWGVYRDGGREPQPVQSPLKLLLELNMSLTYIICEMSWERASRSL